MNLFLLTYLTQCFLQGNSLEIKLHPALILQELYKSHSAQEVCSHPRSDRFQTTKLPPSLQIEHEINPLLHCSLSLLLKYLLPQLSLVSSTNSYKCWLIFSHQKSSREVQCWGNFYIKSSAIQQILLKCFEWEHTTQMRKANTCFLPSLPRV